MICSVDESNIFCQRCNKIIEENIYVRHWEACERKQIRKDNKQIRKDMNVAEKDRQKKQLYAGKLEIGTLQKKQIRQNSIEIKQQNPNDKQQIIKEKQQQPKIVKKKKPNNICKYCNNILKPSQRNNHQKKCQQNYVVCNSCNNYVPIRQADQHFNTCGQFTSKMLSEYPNISLQRNNRANNPEIIDFGDLGGILNLAQAMGLDLGPLGHLGALGRGANPGRNISINPGNGISVQNYMMDLYQSLKKKKGGLTKQERNGLVFTKFKKTKNSQGEDDDDKCTICMDVLEEGQQSFTNVCKHVFHSNCIKKWFQKESWCPNCRFDLKPASQVKV